MFEKHQHEEQFLEDMSQKQEINKFSEDSQQELADNEPHRDLGTLRGCHIDVLIAIPSPKYSRSPTTIQKTNCDFTSIPGFGKKKNTSRGPKHGVSERQVMFYKAKKMLQGGTNKKDTEGHWRSTRLAKSKSCLLDRIARERHDYTQLRKLNGCRSPNIGFFV